MTPVPLHCVHECVCQTYKASCSDEDISCQLSCWDRMYPHSSAASERKVCCAICPCSTPTCEDTCPEWHLDIERDKVLDEFLEELRSHKSFETYCEQFGGLEIERMVENVSSTGSSNPK